MQITFLIATQAFLAFLGYNNVTHTAVKKQFQRAYIQYHIVKEKRKVSEFSNVLSAVWGIGKKNEENCPKKIPKYFSFALKHCVDHLRDEVFSYVVDLYPI